MTEKIGNFKNEIFETSESKRCCFKNEVFKISESKRGDFELNDIYAIDALEGLKGLPDNCIDLMVTSPPYDNLRDYKGFSLDLSAIGKEVFRVMKDGGIAVMVMQDQTKNFGKTLTTFKTAIDWCEKAKFKLFETLIYRKYGAEGHGGIKDSE